MSVLLWDRSEGPPYLDCTDFVKEKKKKTKQKRELEVTVYHAAVLLKSVRLKNPKLEQTPNIIQSTKKHASQG